MVNGQADIGCQTPATLNTSDMLWEDLLDLIRTGFNVETNMNSSWEARPKWGIFLFARNRQFLLH